MLGAFACIGVALIFARPAPTPGPAMRDFEAYYSAGNAWRAGADPYSTALWQYERAIPGVNPARAEFLPFIGPPHALPMWALFARAPFPIAAAIWRVLLLLAAAAVLAAAARLCGARGGVLHAAMLLPLAPAFAPLTSAVALGQVALPAFAATLLALLSIERGALPAAAAFFAAALQPNVALAFAGALRRPAAWLAAGAAGAAVLLTAAFALRGFDGVFAYLAALGRHGAAERFDVIQITPGAVLFGCGLPAPTAAALALLLALLAAIATVAAAARRRFDPLFTSALAAAATPFIVPFFHEHDLIVTVLPMLYALLRLRGTAAVIGAVAGVTVAIDWLGLAQRPGGIAQSALLATAFAAMTVLLAAERRVGYWPFAALAALAVAAPWALAHPAPVWPDALPPGFALPAGADAAQAWAAEQRASGLLEPNGLWAALRSLSLAGCAGLWVALTYDLPAKYRPSSYRRTA